MKNDLMKHIKRILVSSLFVLFVSITSAQEHTVLYYYVSACKLDTKQNKQIYVSKISSISFDWALTFMEYRELPAALEEQYLFYLSKKNSKKKVVEFKFANYYLSSDKREICRRIKLEKKKFRKEGYHIYRVRNFEFIKKEVLK